MRAVFALPFLAAMAGCAAQQGPFPSLAPRPVERELAVEPAARPVPSIPNDPLLASRIAALVRQAREGDTAFEAAIGSARAAVGRAGPAGSEGWTAAQMEISRVEAARVATVNALAELDALSIERAGRPTSPGDTAALTAAVADVQAIADRQHAALERLRASLSPA